MTILGLAGALFCERSGHRQNGLSYVPKKIRTWMLREARGGLKATVGNRVTTRLSLYPHSFCPRGGLCINLERDAHLRIFFVYPNK